VLEEWLPHAPRYWKYLIQLHLADAAVFRGDLTAAEGLLLESYRDCSSMRDKRGQSATLVRMIDVAMWRGDYDGAERLLVRAQTIPHLSGNYQDRIRGLASGGLLAWQRGDPERATLLLEEGLVLAREQKRSQDEPWILAVLAHIACEDGRYGDVEALCGHVLEATPAAWHRVRRLALLALGRAALLAGETARAVDQHHKALDHARQAEHRPEIAATLEYLAWALAADGQHREATQLLAVAARERDEMGIVLPPLDRPHHERAMEAVRGAIDEAAFATARRQGEALGLDEAVTRALGEQSDRSASGDVEQA
jgi:non-specific serine/threonine protein kinase